MDQVEFVVEEEGGRLDRFVAEQLREVSRSQVTRWIQAGDVRVNGRPTKAGHRLAVGDIVHVTVPPEEPRTLQPWDIPLSVLYEDEDCVIIDKPAGMVVHPATSHRQDTLVNALLSRYPEIEAMVDLASEGGDRPGIVHRLDRDTSGVLLVARHQAAWEALRRQFKQQSVQKVYLALLNGRLAQTEGQIVTKIGRHPGDRKRMAVLSQGREAVTGYRVRQFLLAWGSREFFTLVEAHPLTGRTHQLRVHWAHVGHPVVGDRVYGWRKQRIACPRQFLHAHRLGFHRPADGEWIVIESPLPDDLQQVLSDLRSTD